MYKLYNREYRLVLFVSCSVVDRCCLVGGEAVDCCMLIVCVGVCGWLYADCCTLMVVC